MEKITRDTEEKLGWRTDSYIELHQIIKVSIAKITKERTGMEHLIKDFVKKHKAGGKAVFVNTVDFYLDALQKFEFVKILAALAEEIQT